MTEPNNAANAAGEAVSDTAEMMIELVETINWGAVLVAFLVGGAVTAGMLWLFYSQEVGEDDTADAPDSVGE